MNKFLIILVCLSLAITPLLVFAYYRATQPSAPDPYVTVQYAAPKAKVMEPGAEMGVLSCKILDGCIFYVLLENNEWYQVRLTVATKEEATAAVVELLKNVQSPTVVLRRQLPDYWVVDFNLTILNERTTLLQWLQDKQLTL